MVYVIIEYDKQCDKLWIYSEIPTTRNAREMKKKQRANVASIRSFIKYKFMGYSIIKRKNNRIPNIFGSNVGILNDVGWKRASTNLMKCEIFCVSMKRN